MQPDYIKFGHKPNNQKNRPKIAIFFLFLFLLLNGYILNSITDSVKKYLQIFELPFEFFRNM